MKDKIKETSKLTFPDFTTLDAKKNFPRYSSGKIFNV